MDLELSDQQELLVKTCEDFASKEIRPKIREKEKEGVKDLRDQIYELGLFGVEFPEIFGGAGMGMIERALVLKTLSEKGDGGTAFSIFYPLFPMYAIFELSESKDILKDAISGKIKMALAKCGLAPSYIRTKPITPEEEIKVIVEDRNIRRIIFFAEEKKGIYSLYYSDEFEFGNELFRSGVLSSPAFEVKVKKSEKIAENVLSNPNWEKFLSRIKLSISAICVGICKAAADYALEYALERIAFGRPIAYHQAISFMLADMDILSDSLEISLYKSCYDFDKQKEFYEDSSTELILETLSTGRKIVSDAVQILGGHGYIKDHPVEKWMRDFEDIIHTFGSPTMYEGSIKNLQAGI